MERQAKHPIFVFRIPLDNHRKSAHKGGYTLRSIGRLRPGPEVLGVTSTSQGYGKRDRNLSPAFSAASFSRKSLRPENKLVVPKHCDFEHGAG